MGVRVVLGGIAVLIVALSVWRVLVTARRGAPSGRWFLALLASALLGAVALLW